MTNTKYYEITFIWTDESAQQFGTGAWLTASELDEMRAYLANLCESGVIGDPQVFEPVVVNHDFAAAMAEIKAALEG